MNIKERLIENSKDHPDKIAVIFGQTRIPFNALKKRAFNVSSALKKLGLKKGDKIVSYLPNIPQFVEIYTGALACGIICVPLDFRIIGEELQWIIDDSDTKAIFTTMDMKDPITHIFNALDKVENVIFIGEGDKAPGMDYNEFVASGTDEEPNEGIGVEDEALFLYTSGSTGRPKGVILEYRHLDLFPDSLYEIVPEVSGKENISSVILPMSHVTGPVLVNTTLKYGNSLVIYEHMRPSSVWSTVEKEKVNWFNIVPPLMQMLLSDPNLEKYDLSSLKFIAMMGMSVPKPLMEECYRRIPTCKIIQGYGLTETSPLLTLQPLDSTESKMGTVGKIVPGAEIKFVDEDGREVEPGAPGELIARGPQIMKGYYKQPEETAKVIKDGWFHTGDVGTIDEDGFVYHHGRVKDMIITGGMNVFPAEVESVLLRNENILFSSVIGLPDDKMGEVLGAFLVKRPGSNLSEQEVKKYCRENAASYKVPKIVTFLDELPLVGPGKVDKKALKALV